MIPEWFSKLFFGAIGVVLVCGDVLAIIVMIAIIKSAIEEMELKGRTKTMKRKD